MLYNLSIPLFLSEVILSLPFFPLLGLQSLLILVPLVFFLLALGLFLQALGLFLQALGLSTLFPLMLFPLTLFPLMLFPPTLFPLTFFPPLDFVPLALDFHMEECRQSLRLWRWGTRLPHG